MQSSDYQAVDFLLEQHDLPQEMLQHGNECRYGFRGDGVGLDCYGLLGRLSRPSSEVPHGLSSSCQGPGLPDCSSRVKGPVRREGFTDERSIQREETRRFVKLRSRSGTRHQSSVSRDGYFASVTTDCTVWVPPPDEIVLYYTLVQDRRRSHRRVRVGVCCSGKAGFDSRKT